MSTTTTPALKPNPVPASARRGSASRRSAAKPVARAPRPEASKEAKRLAAALLEVLAGARTPLEAATALGVSLPRYYVLEQRALEGLVAACEPRPLGRLRTPERELATLRQEVERLQRECTRKQALVRAAQRTVGLSLPEPAAARKPLKGKRRRRPTVRALRAARVLQSPPTPQDASSPADGAGVSADGTVTTTE